MHDIALYKFLISIYLSIYLVSFYQLSSVAGYIVIGYTTYTRYENLAILSPSLHYCIVATAFKKAAV